MQKLFTTCAALFLAALPLNAQAQGLADVAAFCGEPAPVSKVAYVFVEDSGDGYDVQMEIDGEMVKAMSTTVYNGLETAPEGYVMSLFAENGMMFHFFDMGADGGGYSMEYVAPLFVPCE